MMRGSLNALLNQVNRAHPPFLELRAVLAAGLVFVLGLGCWIVTIVLHFRRMRTRNP
jgi:hypothetical protein